MFLLGFDDDNKEFANQLIQILTCEGKSIILGILAAILDILGL